jgi:hypothetical protein
MSILRFWFRPETCVQVIRDPNRTGPGDLRSAVSAGSETRAERSETRAERSETRAERSETRAERSETRAERSETRAERWTVWRLPSCPDRV